MSATCRHPHAAVPPVLAHGAMQRNPWHKFLGLLGLLALLLGLSLAAQAQSAAAASGDYPLGPGDVIRIQVFQNPDLTVETRVAESGSVSYPLIGSVQLGGLSIAAAEQRVATALQDGGFVRQPQVNIVVLQLRGNQVAVLGQVNRPGRFPLETANTHLSDMLAIAGGATATGSDQVILSGVRSGKAYRKVVDVPALFLPNAQEEDPLLQGGDVIYVQRAPLFYIYGEVQRPGAYRIERGMTVMQALAQGGGPTLRGSESRLRLHRRNAAGQLQQLSPEPSDAVQADDVLYVPQSIF